MDVGWRLVVVSVLLIIVAFYALSSFSCEKPGWVRPEYDWDRLRGK